MKGADVLPVFIPTDMQGRGLILLGGGGWWSRGGGVLCLVRFLRLLLFLLLCRSRSGWGRRRRRRVVLGEWWGWRGCQDLDWLCSRAGIRVRGRSHGLGG